MEIVRPPYRVLVVGAGTSAPAGAPVLSSFLDEAKRIQQEGSVSFHDVEVRRGFFGDISPSKRFSQVLDHHHSSLPEMDVEELILTLDLHERFGSRERVAGDYLRGDDVRYVIGKTLLSEVYGKQSETHRALLRGLRDLYEPGEHLPVVVNLNWDLFFERSAASVNELQLEQIEEDFVAEREHKEAPPFAPVGIAGPGARVRHVKPHGSLDWWFCREAEVLMKIRDAQKLERYWDRGSPPCPYRCGSPLVSVLQPPVPTKFSTDVPYADLLHELWTSLWDIFSCARSIDLIGYSFPETDMEFKVCLLSALSENPELESIRAVTRPKTEEREQAFRENYRSVFSKSQHADKLTFDFRDFESWVDEEGWADST